MTYCLGIRVREGLVGLADGRVTAGNQIAAARKAIMLGDGDHRFFVMTSGLRSVRDKVIAYLKRDHGADRADAFPTLLDAVAAFAGTLRRVREEDADALRQSDLTFNLHAVIGGQLAEDAEPQLVLVYPEGNWIAVDERTPYISIGSTSYGKPILDRGLSFETGLRQAVKLAYLSFDSTRLSATDVGFPIDMLTFEAAQRTWRFDHFEYDEMVEQRQWWNQHIKALAERMPDGHWLDTLLPPGAGAADPRLSVVQNRAE